LFFNFLNICFSFPPHNNHKINKKDLNFKKVRRVRHFQNECFWCQVEVELNLSPDFGYVSLGWLLRISTIIHQQGFQLRCDGVGEENVVLVPIVPLVLEKHLSLSFWAPALVMRHKIWCYHVESPTICLSTFVLTMHHALASSEVNNLLGKFT
jgi:hypothetical protein